MAWTGLLVKDVMELVECELASLGLEAIDNAEDAALTVSELRTESHEHFEGDAEGNNSLLESATQKSNHNIRSYCRTHQQERQGALEKPSSFTIIPSNSNGPSETTERPASLCWVEESLLADIDAAGARSIMTKIQLVMILSRFYDYRDRARRI